MIEDGNQEVARQVIYLCGCAVKEEIPDLAGIEDIEAVYAYAAQHRLGAAVAMALESAGLKDRRSSLIIADALKRKILFERAYTEVKGKLEQAGIWYLPLKGMVIKDLHPKPGMREMGDYDILIDADRAEDVKAIMEDMGYETESFGTSNHDVYNKAPFLRFEMHRTLFGAQHDERLYAYYLYIERRLIGDGYEKHLSPEDTYLYLCAHEYKHYTFKGTGLRSPLDTYVYLHKASLDMDYVEAEAKKLGMVEFERANRLLAERLFSGAELSGTETDMLEYMMSSGVYGTLDHRVENVMSERGWSKIQYALNRFLVPISKKNEDYDRFANYYPTFYKYKVLLPLLPIYRTIRSLRSGKFKEEATAIKNAKPDPSNAAPHFLGSEGPILHNILCSSMVKTSCPLSRIHLSHSRNRASYAVPCSFTCTNGTQVSSS